MIYRLDTEKSKEDFRPRNMNVSGLKTQHKHNTSAVKLSIRLINSRGLQYTLMEQGHDYFVVFKWVTNGVVKVNTFFAAVLGNTSFELHRRCRGPHFFEWSIRRLPR